MQEKFRGVAKADGTVVEGYLVRHSSIGTAYILPEAEYVSHEYQTIAIGGFVEVYPDSVAGCTGLQDASGNSICEGDMLDVINDSGSRVFCFVVSFGACGGVKNVDHQVGFVGYSLQPGDDSTARDIEFGLRTDILYWLNGYRCVVSGNIHWKKGAGRRGNR